MTDRVEMELRWGDLWYPKHGQMPLLCKRGLARRFHIPAGVRRLDLVLSSKMYRSALELKPMYRSALELKPLVLTQVKVDGRAIDAFVAFYLLVSGFCRAAKVERCAMWVEYDAH